MEVTMPYNTDLLLDLKNTLLMHPEQHTQNHWSSDSDSNPLEDCGTTACAAGWTCALLGLTVHQARRKSYNNTSEIGSISKFAGNALGLTDREAVNLFINTLDEENPEAAALDMIDEFIEKGKAQGS